jgi:hypothetical protein
MVISEGRGVLVQTVIFDRIENLRILLEQFCPNHEKEGSIEDLIAQCKVREGFRKFESNLACLK